MSTKRLTRDQVREIDRRAIEDFYVPGVVLMENAARAASAVASEMLGSAEGKTVRILCGGGNNGGDGLAIARHLHNAGARVEIELTADPQRYRDEAKTNWLIVKAMELPCRPCDPENIAPADLIIDAIFGTGLDREPRPPFDRIAARVNGLGCPVLAIDVPSGLDCDAGRPLGACIRATATITFVAEKVGFPQAAEWLGIVSVGDIGCPKELIDRV